jgi:hypothetical protein
MSLLKPKTPEPASTLPPINERFESLIAGNQGTDFDQRLSTYISQNARKVEYAEYLVKRHPEKAVRALMASKMVAHEQTMKVVERQSPQAKEWLEQQPASLKVNILERLKKIPEFYREAAKLRMIKSAKANVDFTPRPNLGTGMSV